MISIGSIDNIDFSSPYITDMDYKDKTTFYLTTWNGLFRLDFETENLCESTFSLTPLTQYEAAWHAGIERKMTSVLWDARQDILWTSSFGGGIVKLDISGNVQLCAARVRYQSEWYGRGHKRIYLDGNVRWYDYEEHHACTMPGNSF